MFTKKKSFRLHVMPFLDKHFQQQTINFVNKSIQNTAKSRQNVIDCASKIRKKV